MALINCPKCGSIVKMPNTQTLVIRYELAPGLTFNAMPGERDGCKAVVCTPDVIKLTCGDCKAQIDVPVVNPEVKFGVSWDNRVKVPFDDENNW